MIAVKTILKKVKIGIALFLRYDININRKGAEKIKIT